MVAPFLDKVSVIFGVKLCEDFQACFLGRIWAKIVVGFTKPQLLASHLSIDVQVCCLRRGPGMEHPFM